MAQQKGNPVLKVLSGEKPNLRPAVNAMCAHCMGCTENHCEPGFRKRIRNCSSWKCPLWHVRPGFGVTNVERDRSVYRD